MENQEKNLDAEKILEELKKEGKPEKNKENKQLRNILIGAFVFIALLVGLFLIFDLKNQFEYKGLKFNKVREGELLFYHAKIPLYDDSGKYYNDFNIYLRKDPRKLENIEIEGEFIYRKLTIIKAEDEKELNCQGDGVIAVANLNQLYEVIKGKMRTDENATCDIAGRYSHITLKSGNETKIKQKVPFCYEVVVNNCEILEATEKIMLEILVKRNNEIISKNLSIEKN